MNQPTAAVGCGPDPKLLKRKSAAIVLGFTKSYIFSGSRMADFRAPFWVPPLRPLSVREAQMTPDDEL
jgi:hypothetical protein